MNFDLFLSKVNFITNQNLNGVSSHLKMAPLERDLILKNINFNSIQPKIAAVMMLFYPKNNLPHLALIVRNSFGVHSSQIAFPGGKYEVEDIDFKATALRETQEEIGVHPEKINVIKAFTKVYITPSNFEVYPFLGVSKTELKFELQIEEVAGIVEMPLSILMDDSNLVIKKIDTSYAKSVDVPAFQVNEHLVWGATAMMLSELKDALKLVL